MSALKPGYTISLAGQERNGREHWTALRGAESPREGTEA